MKDSNVRLEMSALNSEEIQKTYGGTLGLGGMVVYWILCDIAANPKKSVDAFMSGWNSW